MSVELFKQLVSRLAEALQLPEMWADDDGYLCLQFDGERLVHVQFGAEDDRITLLTEVGDVDPEYKTTIYCQLLEANLLCLGTGGATFSLQLGGRTVNLQQMLPATITSEAFQETLRQFVDTAEDWGHRLQNAPDGWETEAERNLDRLPDDDEFVNSSELGDSGPEPGFMRV